MILLEKVNKIFPLSANVAMNILSRIFIVNIISDISLDYARSSSHLMVILGVLNAPYYFSMGASIRVKSLENKNSYANALLHTLISSIILNIFLGIILAVLVYFCIDKILMIFKQPLNIVEHTQYFFKCYAFCLVSNSLFQGLQQIYIGLNKGYISTAINLLSNLITFVFLYLLMNRFKNSDDFSIPFTYPFLIYGLVGSAILLFLLVRDSDIKILENLNINNKYIIKEFIYLLKISIPFCIQNIHGTFVHFVHVIVIGMICPRLLPLYQVLIQYNLVVLIIILGSIQAFGLDTIQNVQKRALDLFLQKMKRYLTIIFSLMILCSLFFYFKLFFKIKTYNLLISEKNDLLFSFFIAFISHFIFVIRNINIMTLTNLGDPIFPVMLATSLSLAFGLPMSIILAFLIPYSLTAIHLGILMHYVIATIILMVRGYKNWYFTHDST